MISAATQDARLRQTQRSAYGGGLGGHHAQARLAEPCAGRHGGGGHAPIGQVLAGADLVAAGRDAPVGHVHDQRATAQVDLDPVTDGFVWPVGTAYDICPNIWRRVEHVAAHIGFNGPTPPGDLVMSQERRVFA